MAFFSLQGMSDLDDHRVYIHIGWSALFHPGEEVPVLYVSMVPSHPDAVENLMVVRISRKIYLQLRNEFRMWVEGGGKDISS
jgi:hypothetical protein